MDDWLVDFAWFDTRTVPVAACEQHAAACNQHGESVPAGSRALAKARHPNPTRQPRHARPRPAQYRARNGTMPGFTASL